MEVILPRMHLRADSPAVQNSAGTVLGLRCPFCNRRGTFEVLHPQDVSVEHGIAVGQRRCPHPDCHAVVFFAQLGSKLFVSYPAERLDFDPTDVPAAVLRPLEEAIACHAEQCFTAAAMMVRKTLEELCQDRGAIGGNLKARIQQLRERVVLPQELLDALDDIRLLGNDAAHVESQVYSEVGRAEVEAALDVAKDILKAVYQYSSLLQRLRGLKKAAPEA